MRDEAILDVWFDSGAMPAAQLHYPFEGDETFARRFPADFICEAIDQTRGWFYSLLAVNTLTFGRSPYRNVLCLELLVDQDGQKMSKSRGNVIDPWSILGTQGADALRWNFLSSSSPWTPKRVSVEGITETTRRFLLTLWNTYSFFVTYANLDRWEPTPDAAPVSHVLDRWVRSRLHSTVEQVTDALDGFDALRAAQSLEAFADDLSNWYVRRGRARFWNAGGAPDAAAHATLYECLRTTALLLAPFCPFVADDLFVNLDRGGESVHLADWPVADRSAVDRALEEEVERARAVVSLGLAARSEAKLRVRQPLRRAIVVVPGGEPFSDDVSREIADALNVKELDPVTDLEGLLDYSVVPNFRSLGPKAGARVPAAKDAIARADARAIRTALDATGRYELALGDGTTITLAPDDVDVRAASHQELALARDGGYAVALDTSVDDELRAEGIGREIVRIVNDLRKSSGFEISDRVRLWIGASGVVGAAAHAHRDWIAREVLAVELEVDGTVDAGAPVVEIDRSPVSFRLERAGS
jgi:isoleucyl-tRNA synthetase